MSNYLLDTNILLYYLQGNSNKITILDSRYAPLSPPNRSFMSIASVAELHALALKHRWGAKRWQTLLDILQTIVVVPIDSQDLIDRYAEIDAFSQDKLEGKPLGMTPRNMAKNDLWIAATASLLQLPLITNDGDFNHLHNHFLQIYSINV
jgi:tRNA(fMet)-specific endonuclease VapC